MIDRTTEGSKLAASGAPSISIIMAIRNSEAYLRQALDSIRAQTVDDYEIVVVDGHSSDNGPAIARSYARTVSVTQQGRGFADAWNTGIAVGRGRFVAFLDSDDLWTPDKLRLQLAMFERDPATEYVIGRSEFFLEPSAPLRMQIRPAMLNGSHIAHIPGALLIRREVVKRLGPFETTLTIASDIAWFARLRDTARMAVVDELLLRKRLHGTNLSLTTSRDVFAGELLQIARDRLKAKRRMGDVQSDLPINAKRHQ